MLYKQVHPTLPLTIWNYSEKVQYEGLWNDITLMCRGLVTDDEGNIVARPFKKFFNLDEGKHTPTSEFDVYMKLDGSLGILFNYKGEWVVIKLPLNIIPSSFSILQRSTFTSRSPKILNFMVLKMEHLGLLYPQ